MRRDPDEFRRLRYLGASSNEHLNDAHAKTQAMRVTDQEQEGWTYVKLRAWHQKGPVLGLA
ncbi:hypothetical protein BRAS3843_140007 [Bradyrhizobium sp. STM 3843]|nr:hypothetical protein BRAS3843_140007 [Bradyrhizobium sp. STM 3843]